MLRENVHYTVHTHLIHMFLPGQDKLGIDLPLLDELRIDLLLLVDLKLDTEPLPGPTAIFPWGPRRYIAAASLFWHGIAIFI